MEATLLRTSMEVDEFDHVNKRMKISVFEPRTDRISQLPDDILHHILSFLPQESVEITLSLSKRWLNLWTNLSFFRFGFKPCNHPYYSETNTGLMNFIKRVLSCREKSTFIENFCLSSSSPNCCLDIARVNVLIREVVLRHGVKELDLKLERCRVQFCSPIFVSCESLTSLKLSFHDHCSNPNFPEYFSFPNLETMELNKVVLRKNFASQLSSNCSKLENLVISFCRFVNLKSWWVPYDDSGLHTLPNLLVASISLDEYLWESYVLDFVRVISNVQILSLKVRCAVRLPERPQELDYFSKFHNLWSLDLGEIYETDIRVSIMDNILRSLPALEYLSIDLVKYSEAFQDGSGLPNGRLSQSLKVVRIGSAYSEKLMIKLVKYFLEEAKGLEKMIVDKPKHLNKNELENFRQKLQALPNGGALIEVFDASCKTT